MESETPFARMPTSPESIIDQVRRQLRDDAHEALRVQADVLDSVAASAVWELWQSRVRTFVPVLALRQAREVLQEQDRLILPVLSVAHPAAMAPRDERPGRDVLAIPDGVMPLDEEALPM